MTRITIMNLRQRHLPVIRFSSLFVCLLLSATALADSTTKLKPNLSLAQLEQILASPDRPSADRLRDNARQPSKIMAFSRVAEDDVVLDLFAGDGWYTELYARAVGPQGKVYAQNDDVIWRFAEQGIKARTENGRLANVVRLDKIAIDNIDIPEHSVDLVFMALNYHDLFFTQMMQEGQRVILRDKPVDHRKVLAKIKSVLKDQGVVVIIDHSAKKGSGIEVANQLHRIDPELVKAHFLEAGFSLLEEAYYLRNKNDNLGLSVFDPKIRGNTDRFIFKFGK